MTDGLTIVIPARNRAALLPRTLSSVAAQMLRPLNVVLVDNGSTDETLQVMRSWSREPHGINVSVVTESTPGAAEARNRGLEEVVTEWTMFFDSDDIMEPEHCARAMAYARSCTADIIGWNVRYRAINGKCVVKPFYTEDVQFHSLMHGSMSTQRYMARTELFRSAGGWGEGIRYWDDIELGARLLALNPVIRKIAGEPTVEVLSQVDSISGDAYSDKTEQAEQALSAICRTLGSKGPAYVGMKTAILAADCRREGTNVGKGLLDKVLSGNSIKQRIVLLAVYAYRRL